MSKRGSPIAVAAALVLLAAGCGGGTHAKSAPGASAAPSPPKLQSIGQLRSVFNSASREPTLVVLISPT